MVALKIIVLQPPFGVNLVPSLVDCSYYTLKHSHGITNHEGTNLEASLCYLKLVSYSLVSVLLYSTSNKILMHEVC